MFFIEQRQQFFRVLTSKYREQVKECLSRLYQYQFSSSKADYGQSLSREQVLDVFQEALMQAPLLQDFELQDHAEGRFKHEREQAAYILTLLIEHGWLEKQLDEVSFQSTFAFSRYGRLFTEPFVGGARSSRTRQRNTRNTHNALMAFVNSDDVYDLIDAWEFSERIVADFTDVIAELDERRRELVKQVDEQVLVEQAAAQFFDFMETRFESDLSIRLSADSVEKYRDKIVRLTSKLRQQPDQLKVKFEQRLRQLLPEMQQQNRSIYIDLLSTIEFRIKNASDAMLPQVRSALQSFTKRADIIIRQMSYINSQQHNDVLQVCQQLAQLSVTEQDKRLQLAARQLDTLQLRFVDPQSVRLFAQRSPTLIDTGLHEQEIFDQTAHKELYIQQQLQQAFFINDATIRQFINQQLKDQDSILTSQLPINSATDLLALSHVIEAGSASADAQATAFEIQASGRRINNLNSASDYLQSFDEFIIRKRAQPANKDSQHDK